MRLALYPMVEESDATGRVARVYADLLDPPAPLPARVGMPFVPSLFKSLATCPGYLVLAYEQAASVLAEQAFADAAQALADSVRDAARPPQEQQAREVLAGFVTPLSRMLLLACGLLAAVRGELDGLPAAGRGAQPDGPAGPEVRPVGQQPTAREAGDPQLYGELRAALGTPLVNTVWRALAGRGLLASAWRDLRPQVSDVQPAAEALQERARQAARALTWPVVASPGALQAAGIADAGPGMAAVLDAYVVTLPRVLALAGSSGSG